jgi:threonine/homoserine/homoserine lactone efflux protein
MNVTSSVLAFAVAAGLMTLIPGPDTAMVLATAIQSGRRAARRAALGVGVGLLFWGLATALGLSVILRSTSAIYFVFKLVCAGYLLIMAIRCLRSAVRRPPPGSLDPVFQDTPSRVRLGMGWGFRRAFATAALNPKLGIFFLAVLPQFIPPGASPFAMTLGLSAVQATEAVVWYIVLGAIAAGARRWFLREKVRRAFDATAGTLFLILGVAIAIDHGV